MEQKDHLHGTRGILTWNNRAANMEQQECSLTSATERNGKSKYLAKPHIWVPGHPLTWYVRVQEET